MDLGVHYFQATPVFFVNQRVDQFFFFFILACLYIYILVNSDNCIELVSSSRFCFGKIGDWHASD